MSEIYPTNKIEYTLPFEVADCPALQDAIADYSSANRRDPTNVEREEILLGILQIMATTRELITLMPDATPEELVHTLNAELEARDKE